MKMKKQAKYHSDLTDAQCRVWETILKETQMPLGWQDGRKFISRNDGSMKVAGGSKILPKTMQAIEKAGLIKFYPYPHSTYFRLTEFGRDELTATGRAELADTDAGESVKVGGQWTDAELSLYDPDEPFPPPRPGELIFPPEQVQYEYEIAALKRKLARAEAALVEAMERIALAQKQLEYVPEGKIDALNNQMVLESVNFAYGYLVDAPDAVKRILAGEER